MQYWSFNYKKTPAPATSAICGADDERQALAVAAKWCELEGARFFGQVRPMIVAGPEILGMKTPEASAELASPVEATSASFVERLKTAVGGR